MAEEKRPLESEPQAAPEASTPDVPGAPAPDLSGDISQPVHDGPAQPDPGDVVISFLIKPVLSGKKEYFFLSENTA